jgi:hypothetical protein
MMTVDASLNSGEKSCGSCSDHKGFNYCFWAKFIVAIPALPLIGFAAGSMFSTPLAQDVASGIAVFLAVYIAIKIDRMKIFSGKVVNKT